MVSGSSASFSRRLLSAAAIGGTALTATLWAGPAHAQSTASLSVTSAALGASSGSNEVGSEEAVLTFSVTCPAGDTGYIAVTTTQGGTGTGHTSDDFTCTGSAQSESVTTTSSSIYYAAGQVFVGPALDLGISSTSSAPYGYAAGTASIVSIQ